MANKKDEYIKVRDILGNDVFMNKRTGKKYLIKWTKTGKPKSMLLKPKKK